ncbi:MAG: AppA protein [Parcubacteria group bacterium GW2011_GWA2_43_13]|nr:MAG: AppA protein [Parcubacteria group bacterium GW2011_GWA2_43_13]OGY71348.1 MAG: hypothetical protein A2986_03745 [Candidatus Jacksonbacteria bacterium RIFCSPLOWO2_01_FULL_44_13]
MPSIPQLRYLTRFLSQKEKRILYTTSVTAIILIALLAVHIVWQNTQEAPAIGGKYIEAIVGQPTYINPLYASSNEVDSDISHLVFSGLLKYDGASFIPDLAEKYTIADDQKTYTITLRSDIIWHDGKSVTINDVLFTIAAIQDQNYKSPLYPNFKNVKIQQIDEQTIQFQLEQPFAPFLSTLTVGILPEHIWSSIDPKSATLARINLINPIGSGPYQFKSLSKDSNGSIKQYTLERNPHYYATGPMLKDITFKFYPDFTSAVNALENSSTDGLSFLPPNLKGSLKGANSLNFHTLSLPQYTALFFNQNNNDALKDKKVRTAIAHAINKPALANTAGSAPIEIIDAPIPKNAIGYHDSVTRYEFNTERAQQLLIEAGWKLISKDEYEASKKTDEDAQDEENKNTISSDTAPQLPDDISSYRIKQGSLLSLTITTVDQPEMTALANTIRTDLQSVGIITYVRLVSHKKITSDIINVRAYEALLYGEVLGPDPDPYPFWHSSQIQSPGLNLSLFSNKKADALLEEARKIIDPETRGEKYKQFQDILNQDIPAVFLYSPTYTYVLPQAIKGFTQTSIATPSDRFARIAEWYIKTKRTLK